MAPADKTTGKKSYWRTLLCCAPSLAPCMVGQFWGGNQQIAARIVFWRDFYAQQAKASLHPARPRLDRLARIWFKGVLNVKNEKSTWKHEKPWNRPGTVKNHENQFGTMKNQPGTMKNHLNPSGTMKNHKNPPGTMINQHGPIKTNLEPWKTNMEPWKTMETDLEPWKTNLEPWKP